MKNPWIHLPQTSPFILPEDEEIVSAFNEQYRGTDYELHTELLPEPYAGCRDAPVVLLALNPGYSSYDYKYMLENNDFAASMKNTREFREQKIPFYHLDDEYPENPGLKYWKKLLKQPIQDVNLSACSHGFLLLQLVPYKSKAFREMKNILPSFAFTKNLLLEAMQRNAIIIQLRSRKLWEKHVPELVTYNKRFFCNSCLNPAISPANIGNANYEQVLVALRECAYTAR